MDVAGDRSHFQISKSAFSAAPWHAFSSDERGGEGLEIAAISNFLSVHSQQLLYHVPSVHPTERDRTCSKARDRGRESVKKPVKYGTSIRPEYDVVWKKNRKIILKNSEY